MQGQRWILVFASLLVIGIILYHYDDVPDDKITKVSLALLMGGTVSNLIDRIFFGFVTDFLDFIIWPAFNIADMAITLGVIGLVIYLIKN